MLLHVLDRDGVVSAPIIMERLGELHDHKPGYPHVAEFMALTG